MTPEWTSAIAALAAIVVGLVGTIYATRRQIDAALVSTSRQRWIDSLRDNVAEFLAVTAQISYVVARAPAEWHTAPGFERAVLLRAKIALLSNPTEADHRNLIRLLDDALSIAACAPDSEKQRAVTVLAFEITSQTQAILKREWERVKAGEPWFRLSWRASASPPNETLQLTEARAVPTQGTAPSVRPRS